MALSCVGGEGEKEEEKEGEKEDVVVVKRVTSG